MIKKHTYQVSIPKPCSQSWDKMEPVQGGRFCDSCQKKVTDLSGKTAEEVLVFLMKNPGSCAKIPVKHLNKPIEYRIPGVRKKYHWPAVAAMLVAGVFQLSITTWASPGLKDGYSVTHSIVGDNKEKEEKAKGTDIIIIKGQITDENKEPVPFASITIKKNGEVVAGQAADIDGMYEIRIPSGILSGHVELVVSSVGMDITKKEFKITGATVFLINIEMESGSGLGMGMIIPKPRLSINPGNTMDANLFSTEDLMKFPGR